MHKVKVEGQVRGGWKQKGRSIRLGGHPQLVCGYGRHVATGGGRERRKNLYDGKDDGHWAANRDACTE